MQLGTLTEKTENAISVVKAKLNSQAESFKCAFSAVKGMKKNGKRLGAHIATGAVAVAVAITSTASALGSDNNDSKVSSDDTPAQTSVTTTTKYQEQTVYATQIWWKADIDEYELMEFTQVELPELSESEDENKAVVSYPNISFTVTAADGKMPSVPKIAAHTSCTTRDISGEYYTIKSVSSGKLISGSGFDLVCQILNGEMGSGFSDEALKAQAVAVYTYLRYCDANGMFPVVAAKPGYNSKIENAVRAVEGQVLTYNGTPINAVFCASSAGTTLGSEYVWSKSLPYLKPVACSYDKYDSNYGVKKSFTAEEIKRIIESKTDIVLDPNDVENWFKITERSYGKYVERITIGGKTRCSIGGTTQTITGAVLRTYIMGNKTLRSTAFDISYNNGVFTFTTYGYGHGVGMSQNGAQALSVNGGYKYDQILKFYYSGVSLACSSVNNKAVDRYGEVADVSELVASDPSGCVDEDVSDDNIVADYANNNTAVQTSIASETTAPQVSAPSVSETTTTAVTTVPEVEPPVVALQSAEGEAPACNVAELE